MQRIDAGKRCGVVIGVALVSLGCGGDAFTEEGSSSSRGAGATGGGPSASSDAASSGTGGAGGAVGTGGTEPNTGGSSNCLPREQPVFSYVDDLYGGSDPEQADGMPVASNTMCPSNDGAGCYRVDIHGPDSMGLPCRSGCSGGWQATFCVTARTSVTIQFAYTLALDGMTELGEFTRLYYRNPISHQAVLADEIEGQNADSPVHLKAGTITSGPFDVVPGSYLFDVGCWLQNANGTEWASCFIDDIIFSTP